MSLSPRLVAIQGIEFTPIQIAVQGLLDYIAAGGRTGRSTNTLKLRRITDARGRAVGAKHATRTSLLRVTVTPYFQPEVVIPAASLARGKRVLTSVGRVRSSGTAAGALTGARLSTQTGVVRGHAQAVGRVMGAAHHANWTAAKGRAQARGKLRGDMHATGWARAKGRGERNLPPEIVAVLVSVY